MFIKNKTTAVMIIVLCSLLSRRHIGTFSKGLTLLNFMFKKRIWDIRTGSKTFSCPVITYLLTVVPVNIRVLHLGLNLLLNLLQLSLFSLLSSFSPSLFMVNLFLFLFISTRAIHKKTPQNVCDDGRSATLFV